MLYFIIGTLVGSFFSFVTLSLCRAAGRCDLESENYALRAKLHELNWDGRDIALEDAD